MQCPCDTFVQKFMLRKGWLAGDFSFFCRRSQSNCKDHQEESRQGRVDIFSIYFQCRALPPFGNFDLHSGERYWQVALKESPLLAEGVPLVPYTQCQDAAIMWWSRTVITALKTAPNGFLSSYINYVVLVVHASCAWMRYPARLLNLARFSWVKHGDEQTSAVPVPDGFDAEEVLRELPAEAQQISPGRFGSQVITGPQELNLLQRSAKVLMLIRRCSSY